MKTSKSKSKKVRRPNNPVPSIHTDILKDIPDLLKDKCQSLGRKIPESTSPRVFRASLMQFVKRNCKAPENTRFASVILDGCVWVQLEDI